MNFCFLGEILEKSACRTHKLRRLWFFLVHWQIFPKFAHRDRIRKSSNFKPIFGKANRIRPSSIPLSNGNRTEWSPVRSIIITKLNPTTAQKESDLIITSMITDRNERHEVLLPVNHKITISVKRKNSQVAKERRHLYWKATAPPTGNKAPTN